MTHTVTQTKTEDYNKLLIVCGPGLIFWSDNMAKKAKLLYFQIINLIRNETSYLCCGSWS